MHYIGNKNKKMGTVLMANLHLSPRRTYTCPRLDYLIKMIKVAKGQVWVTCWDRCKISARTVPRSLLIFLVISVFASFVYPTPSHSGQPAEIIRVNIAGDKDKLLLSIEGPYTVEAIKSDIVLDKGMRINNAYVIPTNSGLKIGGREFMIYGIRIIPKKDATIFIDKKRFRGMVDIIRTKETKLLVINYLDVEKYLYGVLYHEVPHYWPMEVLKAQAVAARTFALYRKQIMRDRDYDVTNDIYSQVYGGRASERRRTRKAVDLTRGKILKYKGEILPAYYHSTCAGHTEDTQVVFGKDLAPLKGRACSYCRGAKHMNWKAKLSYKDIEKSLQKYGIAVKRVKHIAAGKRNRSGRLLDVKIKDSKGVKVVEGYKFRLALGPNKIKSTNFSIIIVKSGVVFKGRGWGHGVGMCQWGAFGMAKRRHNYKKILDFYYPGAKIEKF